MNNGNGLLLKRDFESVRNSLIKEGMDEMVCKCFNQVRKNIDYLNELNFGENTNSLNNESYLVERSFKIKETQNLFKYCIKLLDREGEINPHYKLLLENLLFHFQNIFSLERYEVNSNLRCIPEVNVASKISSSFSSISSIIPKFNNTHLSVCNDLEKQLLHERQKELIRLNESAIELMEIHEMLYSEIVHSQPIIDNFQDGVKETVVNTDNRHLIREIDIISEGNNRRRAAKIVLCITVFFLLLFLLRA
ncbi:hypothetical protein OIY81_88 [Cryptosporidium canis]|uniref:SNARE domain-containing protein n=1 Tax=Cryptosporidium canis TaxID=195482 RepID=A0ABQ8PD80_9CRYT|nr:hypothetical protein OJ252_369 [Cryptosporidium canis]KAJ1615079.1 hypothetical protein OIY81_88 [Cryptosporidium canis]